MKAETIHPRVAFKRFEFLAHLCKYAGFCTLSDGTVACDIKTAVQAVRQDMERRAANADVEHRPLFFRTFQSEHENRASLLLIGCEATADGATEVVP